MSKDNLYLQYAAEQFAQAMEKIVSLQAEAEQYKQAILQLQERNETLAREKYELLKMSQERVAPDENIEEKEEV